MTLTLNGVEIDDLRVNGVEVDSVMLNGQEVYARGPDPAWVGDDILVGQFEGNWIVVAPANKRKMAIWGSTTSDTGLANVSTAPDPNSSTFNTDLLAARYQSPAYAAGHCRSIGNYDLPNKQLASFITQHKNDIDALDTTVDGTSTQPTMANIIARTSKDPSRPSERQRGYLWTSSEASKSHAKRCDLGAPLGDVNQGYLKNNWLWVIPVRSTPA